MPKKVISLDELSRFKDKYDDALEGGQVVPLITKEIATISPESGDTQETPFALQGTGTANGTSSVDTGTVGKHIQKQGSVYRVNQLVGTLRATFTDSDVTFTNNGNGSITISGTSSATINTWIRIDIPIINGHTYLLSGVKGGSNDTYGISMDNDQANFRCVNGAIIYTASANATAKLNVRIFANNVNVSTTIKPQLIDLTQWFNGNIPQDLLDHPEHWSWYQTYGDYIAYNTGTLVSGNGQYLVCGGRNLFDGELESGAINNNTGAKEPSSGGIRTKNYIQVIPNTKYKLYECNFLSGTAYTGMLVYFYDKNNSYVGRNNLYIVQDRVFTTPSNCEYILIGYYKSGITIPTNPEIVLSLYYAGEDYSQYYPYEQPKVYDTGTETLLSTGVKLSASGEREDIYDYKEPNGLITRRVGSVDLGTLSWSSNPVYGMYSTNPFSLAKTPTSDTEKANIFCAIRETAKYLGSGGSYTAGPTGNLISLTTNGNIIINTTETNTTTFKTSMSGVYLYYELATPTTEQGTPFSENIEINDFGTMGWYATYTDSNTNELVIVPQGCEIFYPAWYVGFIDSLGQREDIDWTANNVVSQSQLSASATKLYKHHITFENPALSSPTSFAFDIISTSSLVITRTTSGAIQSWSNLQTVFDNAITFLTRDYFHGIILVNVVGGNEMSITQLDGTVVMSQTNPGVTLNNFNDTVTPL